MSLGIKIILLLCSFPLTKPVPQPSHTRAHLWPRPHSTLATPAVFSQGLPIAHTGWCAGGPTNQTQLLVSVRKLLLLDLDV